MFNPYDDRPLISDEASFMEGEGALSLHAIAALFPVFFAAGRKQHDYQKGSGMQHIGTDTMLRSMHAVLEMEGRVEDANVFGKYVNWLRIPETFDGLAEIEYKALSDPKVKAILKSIHGNRYAQELSRRAEGILVYRDERAAADYWNICADEEAGAGHVRASQEFREIAKSRYGFDRLEPPMHPRLLDDEGQAPKTKRAKQKTIKADRFFDEYRDYMTRLNGRTWEQAEADFAEKDNSDEKMTVPALRLRISRAELRRAGKR